MIEAFSRHFSSSSDSGQNSEVMISSAQLAAFRDRTAVLGFVLWSQRAELIAGTE
jgi:hypothetical protein